jgi:hypothetical protein
MKMGSGWVVVNRGLSHQEGGRRQGGSESRKPTPLQALSINVTKEGMKH